MLKQLVRNSLIVLVGLFFYVFGSLHWQTLNEKSPWTGGRLQLEWKIPAHTQQNPLQRSFLTAWTGLGLQLDKLMAPLKQTLGQSVPGPWKNTASRSQPARRTDTSDHDSS